MFGENEQRLRSELDINHNPQKFERNAIKCSTRSKTQGRAVKRYMGRQLMLMLHSIRHLSGCVPDGHSQYESRSLNQDRLKAIPESIVTYEHRTVRYILWRLGSSLLYVEYTSTECSESVSPFLSCFEGAHSALAPSRSFHILPNSIPFACPSCLLPTSYTTSA